MGMKTDAFERGLARELKWFVGGQFICIPVSRTEGGGLSLTLKSTGFDALRFYLDGACFEVDTWLVEACLGDWDETLPIEKGVEPLLLKRGKKGFRSALEIEVPTFHVRHIETSDQWHYIMDCFSDKVVPSISEFESCGFVFR